MRRLAVAALLLCLAAGPTAAQPPSATVDAGAEPPRRDRAISVGLWSLQGLAGIAGQYEELLPNRRWSWIASGGIRSTGRQDYRSVQIGAGGEARYWIGGSALWADAPPRSMVGFYVGGRADLAWTHTRHGGEGIGDNLSFALTGTLGYRFLIRGRVELTPSVGLGLTSEIDPSGRLPVFTRGTGRLGMTVGWMF